MYTVLCATFTSSLKRLAEGLVKSKDIDEIIQLVCGEVSDTLDINSAWIYLHDREDDDIVRLVISAGPKREVAWQTCPVLHIKGDPFLEEILYGGKPVYVKEACLDPRTNKELVAELGNRTLYNVPISVAGVNLGVLGMGTFHDEGTRDLGILELDYLRGIGYQTAEAIWRTARGL